MGEWRIILDERGRTVTGPGFDGTLELWTATVREGRHVWPLPGGWNPGRSPTSEDDDGVWRAGTPEAWKVSRAIDDFYRSDVSQAVNTELGRYATGLLGGDRLLDAMENLGAGATLRVAATGSLEAMPWELIEGRAGPLLTMRPGGAVRIIREIVRSSPALAAPLDHPLRVLFVVGCALSDRQIAPALEVLGIVRRLEGTSGTSVRVRVALQADLAKIQDVVRCFRPHVVHLISHGTRRTDGTGVVILTAHDGTSSEVSAEALFQALTPDPGAVRGKPGPEDRFAPPIVVVNACDSAGDGVPGYPSPGNAPFGLALARLGVQAVVAMSGKVADATARAFSRALYEWLANGRALSEAVSCARHHGILLELGMSENRGWARPVVYGEDPTHVQGTELEPLRYARSLLGKRIEERTQDLPFGFCDRVGATTTWEEMLESGEPTLLLVRVPADVAAGGKLGCTWLLERMGMLALGSSRLPMYLDLGGSRSETADVPRVRPGPAWRESLDALRAFAERVDLGTRAWAKDVKLQPPTILWELRKDLGSVGSEPVVDLHALRAAQPGLDLSLVEGILGERREDRARRACEILKLGVRLQFAALQSACETEMGGQKLVVLVDGVERSSLEGRGLLLTLGQLGAGPGLGISEASPVLTVVSADLRAGAGNPGIQSIFMELIAPVIDLRPWPDDEEWVAVVEELLLSIRRVGGQAVRGLAFANPNMKPMFVELVTRDSPRVASSLPLVKAAAQRVVGKGLVIVDDETLLQRMSS